MIKRKSFITILITILIIFVFSSSINATEIEKGNYSKRYEEWLKLSDEEKKNTIAPLPLNVRGDGIKFNTLKNTLKASQIPASYDLRDYINIEVKDQMHTGQCWAFSANSSIETYLALKGESFNFSERHMEYNTACNFIDGENEEALNRFIGDGGFDTTAFTYYSRGSGPILEEDMPFENNENMIKISELPINSAIQKVDDMVYFPNIYKYKDNNGNLIYEDANGIEYSKTEIAAIRNVIKEHIMKNGAITVSIYAPAEFYNESTYADNLNEEGYYSNHAVTIIGWDDNYSKTNFINQPTQDGAYIVLNSWGAEWGDNGVYYISYEDFLVEAQMRGVTGVSNIEYDNLYQHDTSEMWSYIRTPYTANVFTAESNEILTEVMIGTWSEQTCDIYINSTSGNLNINNLTKIASDVKLKPGYTTVELDSNIRLTAGSQFAIVVELTSSNYTGIGIENNDGVVFGNAKSNLGESFVSLNGTDWIDIYNENDPMNLSIKAYTKAEQKSIEVSDITGVGYENLGGEFNFIIDTSYLEKGNTANISVYKENEELTNKFKIKGNTIRGKGAYITIECPSDVKAGEYNVNIELSDFDTINKTFVVNEADDNFIIVQFEDKNFFNYAKSKVENYIENEAELKIIAYKEEFDKVTEMWDAELNDISDITGIEYFTNLEVLNLSSNNIKDLSPLKDLNNLEILYLVEVGCEDFSALNNLTNLKELYILFNVVNDLTFLENLSQLEYLYLGCSAPENEINIENIFKLKKLKGLDLTSWTWITEK